MNPIAISNLRANLSNYLEEIKTKKKPLVFWNRNKKEYLILPYPKDEWNEIFEIYENLEDKIINLEYYKGLENNMKDWLSSENDNLFE